MLIFEDSTPDSMKDLLANQKYTFCHLLVRSICMNQAIDMNDTQPDQVMKELSDSDIENSQFN